MKNGGTESLSKLLKVTQLVTGGTRFHCWQTGPKAPPTPAPVEMFADKAGGQWTEEAASPGQVQQREGTLSFSRETLRHCPCFSSSHRFHLQPSQLMAQHRTPQGVPKSWLHKASPGSGCESAML